MKTYRLALIGFGNVGQGFAQILHEHGDYLASTLGADIKIVAINDLLKGSIYNPDGFSPNELLKAVQNYGKLDSITAPHRDWSTEKTITDTNADVIFEISYTDLKTGEPALTYINLAMEHGKHVCTTNKGPIALHYPEIIAKARNKNIEIGAEGTVMSGTPSIRLGLELLAGSIINKVQGILNGTTNYILTQMENGATYDDALAQAQEKGYAEADPTGDVEGFDAAGKVVILANLLMGQSLTMADVDRTGITGLTPEDIKEAQAANERWKLIGTIELVDGHVKGSVKPIRLPMSHPLASVGGATNALTYTTELLGDVTVIGPGAGRIETGYSLLADLLAIHRK
ncbi:MAG: homoserine dehydrogenase [Anaerolineaceae bacterium 4572_78]|nr:MAG: homoserine dehydrogenase [Anaerolineaceae bacterium 4572_78]